MILVSITKSQESSIWRLKYEKKYIYLTSKGFSLIELCIVMAILAILAGSITPIFIKRIQIKAGEKTAFEISAIEQAALAYYVANNVWPSNIQTLQYSGYINPSWVLITPGRILILFLLHRIALRSQPLCRAEWTSLVASDLPTSSISPNSVSSTVPTPGSLSASKGLYYHVVRDNSFHTAWLAAL